MLSTSHSLLLTFIALISVVNGDSSGQSPVLEPSEANSLHPAQSFSRHITPSRTLLNIDEQEEENGRGLNAVQSLANLFQPASNIPERLFGAGPPTSQEVDDDGNVDLVNAPYYESHVGMKRSGLNSLDRMQMMKASPKDRYFRMLQHRPLGGGGSHAWAASDVKRERSNGASLSVESSLDLIRQKFIQELRRRQLMEKQKQIESNGDLLSSIGKRNAISAAMAKR